MLTKDQHGIDRSLISAKALSVIERLQNAHYKAYLVGGCIRDLLVGKTPKDFDVSTNATPEQIRRVFDNSRIIGRRFKIVHVVFGKEIIEVTSFRGDSNNPRTQNLRVSSNSGMLVRDNVYGKDIDEDASRRDFTINAIYYDSHNETILDFHGGLYDLQQGVIDIIGEPETRYAEDPVRIIRALRFSAKLGFKLSKRTSDPIAKLSKSLREVSNARMFEEVNKLFLTGHGSESFAILRDFHIFEILFPGLKQYLDNQTFIDFVDFALKSSDKRFHADKRNTPHFLYAVILWTHFESLMYELHHYNECSVSPKSLRDLASMAFNRVISTQSVMTAIPMIFIENIRSLWLNQFMLLNLTDKNHVEKLSKTTMFRAAYDFLVLRSRFDPNLALYVDFWLPYYEESARQAKILRDARSNKPKRKKDERKKDKRNAKATTPAQDSFSRENKAEVNDRLAKARAWRAAMNLDP